MIMMMEQRKRFRCKDKHKLRMEIISSKVKEENDLFSVEKEDKKNEIFQNSP